MDLQARRAGGDRQPLIAELPHHVKRLTRRLFEREPQLVLRDRALDLGADMRRGLEEAICGDQAVERLVRPLEVVVADVVRESVLRVLHVREHRAAQKLVPQRLPEALDLAERLRMLRPTTDVLDAHARERFFELGLAAPHRVLTSVVGQHLGGLTVRGDTALEGLHHQRRLLMVRERVPDDETAVVVHEHADVQALRAPQPEREDVGLPQLIRRRTLEPTRPVLAIRSRRRRLDHPGLVQDPPHLLLAHAERLEARHHVSNASRPPRLVLLFELDDLLAHRPCLQRTQARLTRLPSFGLEG
jgi:hypothetical protein